MEQNYLALLNNLNQPETNVRKQAEDAFNNQQKTDPQIAISLLNLTLNQANPLDIRQQAVILLRRYISNNWAGIGDKCMINIHPEVKLALRNKLFSGLTDQSTKIQNGIAYCISTVAGCDWPNEWPEFCDLLQTGLSNQASLNASLRVLVEFSTDISIEHLPVFVEKFFSPLSEIITNGSFILKNKMHAFNVFSSCFQLSTECDEKSKKMMANNIGEVKKYFL